MNSLLYLSLMKIKGAVRNQFRTITSAAVTILLILLYGGMLVLVFISSSKEAAEALKPGTSFAVLGGIGMTAILSLSVMLNKRKALVFDTDAYYLFAGPYTRRQVNAYILLQTVLQSFFYALIGCFIMVMMSAAGYFSMGMLLGAFVVYALSLAFFLMITDYIYMWSLVDKKHGKWIYAAAFVELALVAVVFFLSLKRSGYSMEAGFLSFAMGREFHFVPVFGWAKWVLDALIQKNYIGIIPGMLLLLACNLVLVVLFLGFRGDIAEQAVADAQAVSDYVRKTKANKGNARTEYKKIKKIKGEFPQGARAVFYKNMLMMRKTNSFLRKQDIVIIVLYFIISYFAMPDNRFFMFCYMMMLWLFNLLNDEELLGDLKNYQIYLIPDSPLKKLVYAVLPAYFKIAVIVTAAVVFAGVFNRMPLLSVVQYLVMLLGYSMIFIAGTVLSVRILRSRSNVMLENFLRMFIVLLSAVPSVAVGIVLYIFMRDLQMLMAVVSGVTLVMNFVVSVVIIIACQGMMNGREL